MAVTAAFTDQLKQDLMNGVHQPGDTYKIALYTQAAATMSKTTTAYSSTGELATANGYTRDSKVLSGFTVGLSGDTSYIDFDDAAWTSASFTADAALIYNSSRSNKAIAVLTFASTTSTNATWTLVMPAPGASAIVTIT